MLLCSRETGEREQSRKKRGERVEREVGIERMKVRKGSNGCGRMEIMKKVGAFCKGWFVRSSLILIMGLDRKKGVCKTERGAEELVVREKEKRSKKEKKV